MQITLRKIYGSLTFLPPNCSIAWEELKIAQIAQGNVLFQLLNLVGINSHGFYELSRMLMIKIVNNDVSNNSPIPKSAFLVALNL